MNKRISAAAMAAVMGVSVVSAIPVQATGGQTENDTIVLRVCNWEEYIDEGGWRMTRSSIWTAAISLERIP